MGKALLGTHVAPSSLRLLDEVRALRQRVADLERRSPRPKPSATLAST